MQARRGFARLRTAGRGYFEKQGLPTVKMEEWRNTPVNVLTQMDFEAGRLEVTGPAADLARSFGLGREWLAAELVFINGQYAAELSHLKLPKGVRVETLRQAVERNDPIVEKHLGHHALAAAQPFVALNTAALDDGRGDSCGARRRWVIRFIFCLFPRARW